ncbi:MAG TPA: glycerol-3-phosphate acyltransferase [Bacteroidota bacterium]|nr:glycerol-3-phosphate acyltransferase [Bacteroidota bacterium]
MLTYVFSLIIGFFVGSCPTAYLLVKWRKKLDIRKEGTGNVGTMNVYDVTNSRTLGIVVLVIDILKAVAAVLLAGAIFGKTFWTMGVAGLGATLGHIYSPWIGFKGGRGLATTLGVSLVLGWVIAAAWMIPFVAVYAVRRDIHIGNIAASILMPVILAVVPADTLRTLSFGAAPPDLIILAISMAVLILLGHRSIISQYFKPSLNHTINPPARS